MKRARLLTFTSLQQNKHPDTHSPSIKKFQVLHSHVDVFILKKHNDYGKHFSIKYYDNY